MSSIQPTPDPRYQLSNILCKKVALTCAKLHRNWRKTKCAYIAEIWPDAWWAANICPAKMETWMTTVNEPQAYFPQEGYYQYKRKSLSMLECWLSIEWEWGNHCSWVSLNTARWTLYLLALVTSQDARKCYHHHTDLLYIFLLDEYNFSYPVFFFSL